MAGKLDNALHANDDILFYSKDFDKIRFIANQRHILDVHVFLNKQHFYKQRQAKNGKKINKMLSNILRLTFSYLKIIHIVHPGYYSKMKMKIKIKNRSHRYDINRSKSRHGHKNSKYKTFHSMAMFICIKQHLSNI